jgi:hypothetical protein
LLFLFFFFEAVGTVRFLAAMVFFTIG